MRHPFRVSHRSSAEPPLTGKLAALPRRHARYKLFGGILVLFMTLLLLIFWWHEQVKAPELLGLSKVRLGSQEFMLEVANTPISREQGLSNRSVMPDKQGMLFIFDQPSATCFWMKDMRYDIDMLWFDQNMKLLFIKPDASPDSYPAESYCPPKPAKYVIEVAAGTAEHLHLKLGDSFSRP